MTFPEPPENLPSDTALAEVRARLVADGVIPCPMSDQTPEPLTTRRPAPFSDAELREFATGLTTASNSYAAVQDLSTELLAARARLEEEQREVNLLAIRLGEARGLHTKAADELAQARGWARWFAAERDYWQGKSEHWLDRAAMTGQRMGRRVAELEASMWTASDWAAWFAAERDEARADAGAVRGSAMAYRARVMELQSQVAARDARIAELEAAQANRSEIPNGSPDAYIAVKRYHPEDAGSPEWWDRARVFPAGEEWALERAEYAADEDGCEWLPIVADGDGTRAVTAQAEPVGYVVARHDSNGHPVIAGGVVWSELDHARTSEGIANGYTADDPYRVFELREVSGE